MQEEQEITLASFIRLIAGCLSGVGAIYFGTHLSQADDGYGKLAIFEALIAAICFLSGGIGYFRRRQE